MRLQTDPSCFSITAFLADQVALVARQENLPPGAALLRLQELSHSPEGRATLMHLIESAGQREPNADEAAKISAICRELAAWGYGGFTGGPRHDSHHDHRAAA